MIESARFPEQIASMFPALVDAPHLRPFDPERFAAWAIQAPTNPEAAAPLVAIAGFVLSFIPPAARSPLAAALAWPSPTDAEHAHRALALLPERNRAVLETWLRASWMGETHTRLEHAIRSALVSPLRLASLLRLDAANGDDATGITARCPRAGGTVWAPAHEAHDGRSVIPSRHEAAPSHRCSLTSEAGALRFRCELCGLDGDVLLLVAMARGIKPDNRAAVLQAAASLAAAVA